MWEMSRLRRHAQHCSRCRQRWRVPSSVLRRGSGPLSSVTNGYCGVTCRRQAPSSVLRGRLGAPHSVTHGYVGSLTSGYARSDRHLSEEAVLVDLM
jgi:hypothetical protein